MAHAHLAFALALAGRRAEALDLSRLAVKLEPIATNAVTGPWIQHVAVLTHLALGDQADGAGPARAATPDPLLPVACLAPDRPHLGAAAGQPPVPPVGGGTVERRGPHGHRALTSAAVAGGREPTRPDSGTL